MPRVAFGPNQGDRPRTVCRSRTRAALYVANVRFALSDARHLRVRFPGAPAVGSPGLNVRSASEAAMSGL